LRMALQMIVTFGCVALATTAVFSILKIAL